MCAFNSDSALSVGTRNGYCQGVAPLEKKLKYKHCQCSSDTETGLKVQILQGDLEEHNMTLKDKKRFFGEWSKQPNNFISWFCYNIVRLQCLKQ